jgi:hypothetical protein
MMTLASVLHFFLSGQVLYAQRAILGIQGILKKSSRFALEYGIYSLALLKASCLSMQCYNKHGYIIYMSVYQCFILKPGVALL